jgi:UDPglucose--hexose-1-phosphate uridylyltransferase
MTELRQDRTTGAWVIIAPERGLRPRESSSWPDQGGHPREFDPACPFCPGNEARLPGILAEMPARGSPGWQVRVVPNKYPIAQHAAPVPSVHEHHVAIGSRGWHEVIIESPRHDAVPASMSDDAIGTLVSTYRQRFAELIARPGIETVVLFRNHGAAGGASLGHPHSQIVALGMTPPRLRGIAEWMRRCWKEIGRCITCDELQIERADGRRIVEETQSFLAVVPFAASVPFETWIVPKRHQASFAGTDRTECAELGPLLRNTLQRLNSVHGDPPYNFVVESFDAPERDLPHAHWRLRIAPNLVTWGGFELGTGVPVNPSGPEADAHALRSTALRDV